MGTAVGADVGADVGSKVGAGVVAIRSIRRRPDETVGTRVGFLVGKIVGAGMGTKVGIDEILGAVVGLKLGAGVGAGRGIELGMREMVGAGVGAEVGVLPEKVSLKVEAASVKLTFHVFRLYEYYLYKLFIPCIILTLAAFCLQLIPIESDSGLADRISCSFTMFLASFALLCKAAVVI